jgi:hypothetical protein
MPVSGLEDSLALMIETCPSETPVDFQRTTWRHTSEERALNTHVLIHWRARRGDCVPLCLEYQQHYTTLEAHENSLLKILLVREENRVLKETGQLT